MRIGNARDWARSNRDLTKRSRAQPLERSLTEQHKDHSSREAAGFRHLSVRYDRGSPTPRPIQCHWAWHAAPYSIKISLPLLAAWTDELPWCALKNRLIVCTALTPCGAVTSVDAEGPTVESSDGDDAVTVSAKRHLQATLAPPQSILLTALSRTAVFRCSLPPLCCCCCSACLLFMLLRLCPSLLVTVEGELSRTSNLGQNCLMARHDQQSLVSVGARPLCSGSLPLGPAS